MSKTNFKSYLFITTLFIVGVLSIVSGIKLYYQSTNLSDPILLSVEDINKGKLPDNGRVEIGEHWAVFSSSVFAYPENRMQKEFTIMAPITYLYYPVITSDHNYLFQLKILISEYGSIEKIPSKRLPILNNFYVLVKTKRYGTVGAIPWFAQKQSGFKGMIIGTADKLPIKEKEKLQKAYPNVDLNRVTILSETAEKTASKNMINRLIAGVVLFSFGATFLFGRIRKKRTK